MKVSVIIKDPGGRPRHVFIENSLANLQKHVCGYIEAVTIATNAAIICNEEGLIRNMRYNVSIAGHELYGPIVLIGVNGEEFTDWPLSFQSTKEMFPEMWEV